MESTLDLTSNEAFVLLDDDIKNIWTLLEKYFDHEPVTASVAFTDKTRIVAISVEQLVSFKNTNDRSIEEIRFMASPLFSMGSGITFTREPYRPPVAITASCEDENMTCFRGAVSEMLTGFKPWYSVISIRSHSMFMRTYFALVPSCGILFYMKAESGFADSTIIGVTLIVLVFTSWLIKAVIICFPVATFATGHGKERYRVMENIRWGVVVAFVVSIAGSVVFGLIT